MTALSTGCALHAAQPDATPAGGATQTLLEALHPPPAMLLVGEQHDVPEHQALQAALVTALSEQGQLAALVLEMADAGVSTMGLPGQATESEVQHALQWTQDRGGWPWSVYGPVVMRAVRAGTPVLGGNLPRSAMRSAMADTALDSSLHPQALRQQQQNIQQGHCGQLPEHQLAPMARIQIARDQAMARIASSAIRPGQTVMLVAGNQHVRRDLGVPQHLDRQMHVLVIAAQPVGSDMLPSESADYVWHSPARPPHDYCADLKQQIGP